MQRKELVIAVEEDISEEDFEIVNAVYMDYPEFGDKEQVYRLFREFGMIIFYDMYSRAKSMRELEAEIINLRQKQERLRTCQ